jgi:hypothetical protein
MAGPASRVAGAAGVPAGAACRCARYNAASWRGQPGRPSGIQVGRMRVPLGVIGIIYESRPNVTIDAAGCA